MERHATAAGGRASSPASPTTFIKADTTSFRDLVQQLTGLTHKPLPTKLSAAASPRRPSFKLQERRRKTKKLEVQLDNKVPSKSHPPELSVPSPVTPLSPECWNFLRQGTESPVSEEEKAVAEKGFYVYPSTPRGSEPPELLTLFPLTSPR